MTLSACPFIFIIIFFTFSFFCTIFAKQFYGSKLIHSILKLFS